MLQNPCPFHTALLSALSAEEALEAKLELVLNDLGEVFCHPTDFIEPSRDLVVTVTSRGTRAAKLVSSKTRIFQLSEPDFLQFTPGMPPGSVRGRYLSGEGKIALNAGYWCIETLIHESLHATSSLIRRPDVGDRLAYLGEGLTEFLTGYVVYRKYSYCYENCLLTPPRCTSCSYTYRKETKMWGTFCHYISLSTVVELYFRDGNTTWEQAFSDFIKAINMNGYPRFRNIWDLPGKMPLSEKFHRECKSNLPNYSTIFESRDNKPLSYSEIKIHN